MPHEPGHVDWQNLGWQGTAADTSGLGGLISVSDAYKNALQGTGGGPDAADWR